MAAEKKSSSGGTPLPGSNRRSIPGLLPVVRIWIAAFFLLIPGLILFIPNRPAAADPGDTPVLEIEEVVISGDYLAADIDGNLAYAATRGYIHVVDLSDARHPKVIAFFFLEDIQESADINDLLIIDGYLYLSLGEQGLRAYHLSLPDTFQLVWEYGPEAGFTGSANELFLQGTQLFLSSPNGGLSIFNLANPAEPEFMVNLPDLSAHDVDISGNLALFSYKTYIPADDLRIFDISNVQAPILKSSLNLVPSGPGGILEAAIHGDKAYLVAGVAWSPYGYETSLISVDISNPSAPFVIDETILNINYTGEMIEMAISGENLYISALSPDYYSPGYDSYFAAVNISNPAAADIVTTFESRTPFFKLIPGNGGIWFFGRQISYGSDPIRKLEDLDIFGLPAPLDIVVEDSHYVKLHTGFEGLQTERAPAPEGVQTQYGQLPELALFDQYLFEYSWAHYPVSGLSGGVTIYDIQNAPQLNLLGWLFCLDPGPCPLQPEAVAIGGNILYIRSIDELLLYDFSAPESPAHINTIPIGSGYTQLIAQGPILYAGLTYGFEVVDFQDPFNPVSLALETLSGPTNDLVLDGSLLYLAAGGDGLVIYNISDPADPVKLGTYDSSGTALEIEIKYPYAFLADGPGGLQVIDISDPYNPFQTASFSGITDARQIALDRSHVWVLDPQNGLTARFRFGQSAFGTVIDKHGNRLPGITLLSDTAGEQLTGWAGTYSFDFLAQTSLEVVPQYGDHLFLPRRADVSLSPDAAVPTFVMLGVPASINTSPDSTATLVYTDTQGLPTTAVFQPGAALSGTAWLTPTLAVPFDGHTFMFHAFDLEFSAPENCPIPVQLTIAFSNLDQGTVSEPHASALWRFENGGWLKIENGTITPGADGGILTADVCQPGRYALFGPSNLLYLPITIQ